MERKGKKIDFDISVAHTKANIQNPSRRKGKGMK